MGAQQDSSNTPTGQGLVCAIYCPFNLCDLCAALFHVGVHAGTDEGKFSVHVQWCMDPQEKDIPTQNVEQNPLEMLPHNVGGHEILVKPFYLSVCRQACLSLRVPECRWC